MIFEKTQGNFLISTDQSKLDLAVIHKFLSETAYWTKGIPFATVEKAIKNSLCFGVFEGTKQIGLARVISDFATFAYLGDVFILPEYRGKGLSKWLMETLISHPDLQGLRNFLLFTRDAHGLYQKFGFQPTAFPERIMQINRLNIYNSSSPIPPIQN